MQKAKWLFSEKKKKKKMAVFVLAVLHCADHLQKQNLKILRLLISPIMLCTNIKPEKKYLFKVLRKTIHLVS